MKREVAALLVRREREIGEREDSTVRWFVTEKQRIRI
jgi:hypothetical protein